MKKEFENAIQRAQADSKPGIFPEGLSIAVIGESRSGKTTLVHQYLHELEMRQLIDKNKIRFVNGGDVAAASSAGIEDIFRQVKGGAVIIDEFERALLAPSTGPIRNAVLSPDCVVILVGEENSIRDFMKSSPFLKRKFPTVVKTGGTLTENEMEDWRATIATTLQEDMTPMKKIRLNLPGQGVKT